MRCTQIVAHHGSASNVSVGSWLCENALAEALTTRDFGGVAAFGHLAVFGGLFCLERLLMRILVKLLDAIQSRGVRLAIDDFGTGYSPMSLMKQFPIDTIKINRSFVRDLPKDSEDQAIAQATISMSKALGMTVVAEGVETTEQETFLRDHACDEMQGFLFSKPVTPESIPDLPGTRLAVSPPLQPDPSTRHRVPDTA